MLAGAVVAVATRSGGHPVSLLPVNDAPTGDVAPSLTADPTTPTGSPTPTYVLTSPAPNTRQSMAATPDPPRPPGYPLPTGCLSFANNCVYDDATGAPTSGPATIEARRVGPAGVRVRWTSDNVGSRPEWAPVTDFVVRAYPWPWNDQTGPRDPAKLVQARLPATTFEYTFTGLRPGETYMFWVMELNSAGLGGSIMDGPITLPSPAPTPTEAPTASPTTPAAESPSATPSESASP